jgi:nitrate/TMAO reductase-like tetraheme cytochrome c subunit
MASDTTDKIKSIWHRPRSKWLLGIPIGGLIAFGLGVVALGATNYMMHATSSNEFCYSCHSHEAFIKPEYEASSHFLNTSGVRVQCADCHLPKDSWFDLTLTKMIVSLDIIPEMMGKIDTKEKYEEHRTEMAESVWRQFKKNDSRFCRSCHSVDAMDLESQGRSTARRHSRSMENGDTCIDCHYGIVHDVPESADEIMERLAEEFGHDKE